MTDQPALILVDVQQAFREEDFFGGGAIIRIRPCLTF